MFTTTGTAVQRLIIEEAIRLCDFPFDKLLPSLQKEGKQSIAVSWEDLSRYNNTAAVAHEIRAHDNEHAHSGGHHMKVDGMEVSPVIREIDGRSRVLGLFYLPPHTRIVLDSGLAGDAPLAREVFLAEGAHAVDYHYMTNNHRLAVWNALHQLPGDRLPEGTTVHESGDLDHGHSWFDGPGGYNTWVGEAFMEAFVRAFAPTVRVTISLSHPVSLTAAAAIRKALLPPEPPAKDPALCEALRAALKRFLATRYVPAYLRKAAEAWLR